MEIYLGLLLQIIKQKMSIYICLLYTSFLFLNFGFIQVGDFPLDRLDGLDLIYGLDMQADDQSCLLYTSRCV